MTFSRSFTSIFASLMASSCTSRCMSSRARPSCTNASLKASKASLSCETCRATKSSKLSKRAKWSSQNLTGRRKTNLLLRYSRKSRPTRPSTCLRVQLEPTPSSLNLLLRSKGPTPRCLSAAWCCRCQGQMTRFTSRWSSKKRNLNVPTAP